MEKMKYAVIKSEEQYFYYCDILEKLDLHGDESTETEEEIELLTLLIDEYDRSHFLFRRLNPVELLKSFMSDRQLSQKDLAGIAGCGKSYISEILSYKKGMSKIVIRKFGNYFKVSQEAFNRPYKIERQVSNANQK